MRNAGTRLARAGPERKPFPFTYFSTLVERTGEC
jgi:hypothetical protein